MDYNSHHPPDLKDGLRGAGWLQVLLPFSPCKVVPSNILHACQRAVDLFLAHLHPVAV